MALDTGVADALAGNQFDVGVLFSTDPPVTDDNFVVLEDDKTMLAADNIVPVMSQALVDAYGDDFVDPGEQDLGRAHHRERGRDEQGLHRRP